MSSYPRCMSLGNGKKAEYLVGIHWEHWEDVQTLHKKALVQDQDQTIKVSFLVVRRQCEILYHYVMVILILLSYWSSRLILILQKDNYELHFNDLSALEDGRFSANGSLEWLILCWVFCLFWSVIHTCLYTHLYETIMLASVWHSQSTFFFFRLDIHDFPLLRTQNMK